MKKVQEDPVPDAVNVGMNKSGNFKRETDNRKNSVKCFKCSRFRHFARGCPGAGVNACGYCGKNHIEKDCFKRKTYKTSVKHVKIKKGRHEESSYEENLVSKAYMEAQQMPSAILEINGIHIEMEIDTGPCVSLISKEI